MKTIDREREAQTVKRYRYTAGTMDGKTVRGTAKAANETELYALLRSQNLYLKRAARIKELSNKRFTVKQLSSFCQNLSNMLSAGVSIVRSLTILAETKDLPKNQSAVYRRILDEIQKGYSLAAAMEKQEIFPDFMIGLIRSAEVSGGLDNAIARLSNHYTQEYRFNQQIRSMMLYPCFLAGLALIVLTVIFTLILPEFAELFAGIEELPVITIILMSVSDFLITQWYIALTVAMLTAALICFLLHVRAVRVRLDRWKLKTRFLGLGKLNSMICTARFARTVCSLYSSGISPVSAIRAASRVVGNLYLAGQFDTAANRVDNGGTLSAAIHEVDGLQQKLTGVIRVGEESGSLDEMLNNVADLMEYDSRQAGKRLLTLLEPVTILFMALVVCLIMVGVMYPIINSYSLIS